ncbi:MAG: ribosome biogenesis GTPase Der [Terracidiphilus sp.]|nr:ribosome biogenesis GTPase Der [Terracidiphilus sp.]MDR3798536.1 ribosome biogenesis GTPase Der [Terracidiphilus sp.]
MPTYRRSVVPARAGAAQLPLVAIVGRPNVGKSTLFNRITRSRRSIVGDEPGITRDRIYGEYEWAGRRYRLVDMGGIVPDDPELIATEIFVQAKVALEEADVLVMVVDVRTELARPDYELVRLLQRGGKPLFLAVNKVETEALANEAENLRRLGISAVFPVSSEHGQGVGELLDAIAEAVPEKQGTREQGTKGAEDDAAQEADEVDEAIEDEIEEGGPLVAGEEPDHDQKKIRTHGEFEQRETSVAIIGRPNVGKSTLLNALTGTSRAIVSPIAGTTRDAVDEVVEFEGNTLRFVDTAGIRRKGKTKLMAEKMSVVMARRHLEAADVALLIIDATEGVSASDATIGGYAHESGRSVIIVVNKWDLVTTARTDGKPAADRDIFEQQVRKALKYLDYAPVIFLSALNALGPERKGMARVLHEVVSVAQERRKRVSTGQMNRFLERIDFQRAPVPMAKRIRIFYMTQAAVAPPTFVLFTDRDIKLHFAFERFLENQIRETFGFKGTPIWFKVRARGAEKRS